MAWKTYIQQWNGMFSWLSWCNNRKVFACTAMFKEKSKLGDSTSCLNWTSLVTFWKISNLSYIYPYVDIVSSSFENSGIKYGTLDRKGCIGYRASVGIGNAIARKLAKNGMKVVACARNEQQLNDLAVCVDKQGPGEIFPYRCDFRDEAQMLEMFDFIKSKFGTMHVCVNNAGLAHRASILSGNTEDWREMIDVNVIALCIGCRESVKLMKDGGVDDGHVFNINSVAGHCVGGLPYYAATKFAVTALSEGLRKELIEAQTHIRCTSISPGDVETEFAPRLNKAQKAGEGRGKYDIMECLKAEDIADAVLYALQAPAHVNVNETIIRPVEQKS